MEIWELEDNFDKIPESIRNELLTVYAQTAKANSYLVNLQECKILSDNFDKIPESIRNELLTVYAEIEFVYSYVAKILSDNFDKIPESIRNEVLRKFSNRDYGAWYVAKILSDNFDKIPESIRNELIARIAAHKIDYINEILQKNPYTVHNYITKALLEIADFVQKSKDPGAPAAGILLDNFNEELNKPEPQKSKLKSIWTGIEKTLPSITTVAEAVSKIAILFA